MQVKTRAFGAEHEECAKTLFHMAKLCTLQKQPERAEQLYSDALSIALVSQAHLRHVSLVGFADQRWRSWGSPMPVFLLLFVHMFLL